MKILSLLLFVFAFNAALAQTDAVGVFDHHEDVGHPKNAGSAQYDKVTHTYILTGSGTTSGLTATSFSTSIKKSKAILPPLLTLNL